RSQASELAARLRALGAEAIEAPAIRIAPRESEELDRALEGIEDYSVVCLTSPNGATLLAEGLMRRGRDARSLAGAVVAAIGPADYVTFTSSSTVRYFISAAGGVPDGARVVSIGPVTSATAREHGLEVHVEAGRHDIEGLVEALLADVGGGRG